MAILIEPTLFPDSNRAVFKPLLNLMPLSMIALHLHIVNCHRSNLLPKNQADGFFMYRDGQVPKPRLATILAWNQIVRLGNWASPFVVLPFLPSLTHEDEIGAAISSKGAKLHSLSRKSAVHIRDSKDMIMWGPVFLGTAYKHGSQLTSAIQRSNFTESVVMDRGFFDAATAQLPIRSRMEFLAQYGFVNTNRWANDFGIPRVWRLLFQFLSAQAAEDWLSAYQEHWATIALDYDDSKRRIKDDFHNMISEFIAERSIQDVADDKNPEKALKLAERFGNIDDIFG